MDNALVERSKKSNPDSGILEKKYNVYIHTLVLTVFAMNHFFNITGGGIKNHVFVRPINYI